MATKLSPLQFQFIYVNRQLNLLYSEQCEYGITYIIYQHRLKRRSCALRVKIAAENIQLKRRKRYAKYRIAKKPASASVSGDDGLNQENERAIKNVEEDDAAKSQGLSLGAVITIAVSVPLIIILIFCICATICFCLEGPDMDVDENELPKSLIENCRRAIPPQEERDKYLPELFDANHFHYAGPLIILRPNLLITEHDLILAPELVQLNSSDHVTFDDSLNIAYDIGRDVEKITKIYGIGLKFASREQLTTNSSSSSRETRDDKSTEESHEDRQTSSGAPENCGGKKSRGSRKSLFGKIAHVVKKLKPPVRIKNKKRPRSETAGKKTSSSSLERNIHQDRTLNKQYAKQDLMLDVTLDVTQTERRSKTWDNKISETQDVLPTTAVTTVDPTIEPESGQQHQTAGSVERTQTGDAPRGLKKI